MPLGDETMIRHHVARVARGAFTENGALGENILWGPSIEIDE